VYASKPVGSYAVDFRDEAKWEQVDEIEMMFNRALFTPAWKFHSLAFPFGHDKTDARLTLNPKIIAY